MKEKKCHTCKHHVVYYDEIDGKLYHDGQWCRLEETCDDEDLDYDDYYYFDKKDDCKFYIKDEEEAGE
jgi:hypothetical protein